MPNGGDFLVQGYPIAPEPWLYAHRFIEAVRAALLMHAHQPRKGTTIPYPSHLLGTCSIALDYGANEDEAIAALLHDAIEGIHQAPGAREAVAGFGPEVLRIRSARCGRDPAWSPVPCSRSAHERGGNGSATGRGRRPRGWQVAPKTAAPCPILRTTMRTASST